MGFPMMSARLWIKVVFIRISAPHLTHVIMMDNPRQYNSVDHAVWDLARGGDGQQLVRKEAAVSLAKLAEGGEDISRATNDLFSAASTDESPFVRNAAAGALASMLCSSNPNSVMSATTRISTEVIIQARAINSGEASREKLSTALDILRIAASRGRAVFPAIEQLRFLASNMRSAGFDSYKEESAAVFSVLGTYMHLEDGDAAFDALRSLSPAFAYAKGRDEAARMFEEHALLFPLRESGSNSGMACALRMIEDRYPEGSRKREYLSNAIERIAEGQDPGYAERFYDDAAAKIADLLDSLLSNDADAAGAAFTSARALISQTHDLIAVHEVLEAMDAVGDRWGGTNMGDDRLMLHMECEERITELLPIEGLLVQLGGREFGLSNLAFGRIQRIVSDICLGGTASKSEISLEDLKTLRKISESLESIVLTSTGHSLSPSNLRGAKRLCRDTLSQFEKAGALDKKRMQPPRNEGRTGGEMAPVVPLKRK
jgi:hypothetical protein